MNKGMYIVLLLSFIACNTQVEPHPEKKVIPKIIVLNTNPSLQLVNGIFYYKNEPFSGYIQTNFSNNRIQQIAAYYNGKQQNWTYSFFDNGKKEAARYYEQGEKDSTHYAWWENGNSRFSYQFKNGVYHGCFKEYYLSGKPLKQIWYQNGKDSCGQGWRENGKLFMNYVMKGERRFGLMNAQLCYSLEKEKVVQ
ncbi:MAG: toxin-antitoxin system YwqK family antitoxin [Chitinophagaceae bacterium]